MSIKVMEITAGRKNGNSEILLKEALTACEEAGAEVTMINLRDFNILDCTACTKAMSQGKYVGCTLDAKDGKWKFVIQEDDLLKDRTTVAGRAKHLEEIAQTQGGFFSDPAKIKLVQQRKQKYVEKKFKGID